MENQSNSNKNRNSNENQMPATHEGTILSNFFDNDNFWDMPTLFTNQQLRRSTPAVNVKENDHEYEIEMAVPGIPKDNIHVDVEDNMLIITGEGHHEEGNKNDKGRYTRREFSQTSFERRFTLPESVDADQIKAKCDNGIVDIFIPKNVKKKSKKEIKVS